MPFVIRGRYTVFAAEVEGGEEDGVAKVEMELTSKIVITANGSNTCRTVNHFGVLIKSLLKDSDGRSGA